MSANLYLKLAGMRRMILWFKMMAFWVSINQSYHWANVARGQMKSLQSKVTIHDSWNILFSSNMQKLCDVFFCSVLHCIYHIPFNLFVVASEDSLFLLLFFLLMPIGTLHDFTKCSLFKNSFPGLGVTIRKKKPKTFNSIWHIESFCLLI